MLYHEFGKKNIRKSDIRYKITEDNDLKVNYIYNDFDNFNI